MFGKSALVFGFVATVVGAPALSGCTASFKAGSDAAAAPATPPPPPPPPPTAATPAPIVSAPAPTAARGDSVQIPGEIVFDTNSSSFKAGAGSDAVIDQLKAYMDKHATVTLLRIEGHTDNAGTPESNMTLSGQRALTVKNAAIAKGVSKDRLIAVGFGQNVPIANNATEEGRAKNRRTEFSIAEIGKKKYLGLPQVPADGQLFE